MYILCWSYQFFFIPLQRGNLPPCRGWSPSGTIIYKYMAKSKAFFGLRRGSTKSLTFSVLNGEQITKDRVTDIKNPRSISQMQQRLFLKTCALGYAAMKSIVDHSFEGISYGAMAMRHFMKINSPLVRAAAGASKKSFGFAPYGDSTPNMGQFVISQGSLSPVPQNALSATFGANSLAISYANGNTTIGALATSLGCNLGDIATFCALVQNAAGIVKFVWLRLILPSVDGNISDGAITFESNCRFSVQTERSLVATINFDAVDEITAFAACLYGVIRSQKYDMTWKRSTAKLSNVIGNVRYLDDYSKALLTYPLGEPYILNGEDMNGNASAPTIKYSVDVANSTSATVSGNGDYAVGSEVTLSATNVPSGKVGKWNGIPSEGSTISVVGNNVKFTMPEDNVSVSFELIDVVKYNVSVSNSTSSTIVGDGQYAEGDSVTLRVTDIQGGKVGNWAGVPTTGGATETKVGDTVTFTMPANNVEITYSESSTYSITNMEAIPSFISFGVEYENYVAGDKIVFEKSETGTETDSIEFQNMSGTKYMEMPSSFINGEVGGTWEMTLPAYDLKVVVVFNE